MVSLTKRVISISFSRSVLVFCLSFFCYSNLSTGGLRLIAGHVSECSLFQEEENMEDAVRESSQTHMCGFCMLRWRGLEEGRRDVRASEET